MKKFVFHSLAIITLVIAGCTEDIDTSSRYVFREETITSYLSKHDQYSEYYRLMNEVMVSGVSETNVSQLLSARGHYTVFAPTNEAIQEYLDSLVKEGLITEASWDAFPSQRKLDSIRQVIVFNSIIDSGDDYSEYQINAFPASTATSSSVEIPVPNMNDRKLIVQHKSNDSILINDCFIDINNRDILCINGVIHAMHNVISPSSNTMDFLLRKYTADEKSNLVVSAKIVEACGLLEKLSPWRDDDYEDKFQRDMIPKKNEETKGETATFHTPEHRYIGFTLFAETDDFWKQATGKDVMDITMEDVMSYLDAQGVYPEAKRDNNYKSEDNLLYQFITYHLLPERLSTNRLVFHYNELEYDPNKKTPGVAIMEYFTTMGKRRLLKIFESRESNGVYLNRFPNLANDRSGEFSTYHELSCDPDKEGIRVGEPNLVGENDIRNGIIYPIEKLLWYSDETRNNLQKTRIRWSVPSMWPEFINNDIRGNEITDEKHKNIYIPNDGEYKYLENVDISAETRFNYWTGRGNGWSNMQGDELTIRGFTDCTMELPPVPKRGVYELRYAIQNGGSQRGMVQFYWGSNKEKLAAMGIPLDLRQGADNYLHTKTGNVWSDIGGEDDKANDDDYNSEIDKRLRNNGFMKGCNQYCAGSAGANPMRKSNICTRRILLRETMDPDVTYYIRFKTVMDDDTRFFYMDYLEYCAKDVFDNPEKPEDIW